MGVHHAVVLLGKRKNWSQLTYVFATVRRMYNANGLLQGDGYAVSRRSFEDLREFRTLEEAKLYVESIFELEQ